MNCPICKVDTSKPMKHMIDHMTGKAKKENHYHDNHEHITCPMCTVELHTQEELQQHAEQMHQNGAAQ